MKLADFLARLEGVRQNGQGYTALCPGHEDRNPSLSVTEGADGRLLVKCFAGCTAEEIVAALGLEMADLFEGNGQAPALVLRKAAPTLPPIPEEVVERLHGALNERDRAYLRQAWLLSDEVMDAYQLGIDERDGERRVTIPIRDLEGWTRDIRRWLPPESRKGERDEERKNLPWQQGYGTARVYPAAMLDYGGLVLCAGEPDCLALISCGFDAITNTCGEGTWKKEFSPYFRGKAVTILLDHDKAGREGARKRAEALAPYAREVRIASWPGDRPKGWDARDELKAHGVESLRAILAAAVPFEAPSVASVTEAPGTSEEPSWPEPPDDTAYYGLAGDVVHAIEEHTEADPLALLVHVLIGYGSMIGAGSYYEVEGAQHPAREFAVFVGDTAKGRKDTAKRRVHELLSAVENLWAGRVMHGLSSGEGLIWAVRDPIERQEPIREGGKRTGRITGYEPVIVDAGVADKRLLVIESEFASVLRILGRDGNTLSAIVRQAWDDGNLRTMTKNSPAVATGAHISIIGHITKSELLRYLDSTEQGNGFANRYLWLAVKRARVLPEGGGTLDASGLLERLYRAVEHGRARRRISWDHEARKVWHEVYPDLSEGGPGLLGAVTARAEAHVVRLALIYALLDCADQIGPKHLLAALALWEYCERSAAWIFTDATGDPTADRIMEALRQTPSGLSRTQISGLFGRHVSAERIVVALATLEAGGKIVRQIEQTGGRPTERFTAK